MESELRSKVRELARKLCQEKADKRALLDNLARLQLNFDRMPIGCIIWDTSFRAVSWNPAAEKIFGFSAQEALGKHPYDLIVQKEEQPQIDDIWRRLLHGDSTAHSTNRNLTKKGQRIICEWANTPLRQENGCILGVLSIVEDVTEVKRAEAALRESEERYRDLFENANDLIQCLYPDGRIEYVNKAWRKTLGYRAEEIVGKKLCTVVLPADHEQCRQIFRSPWTGKDLGRILLRFRTKAGETIWAEGQISVKLEEGKPIRLMGIFRDITAQKLAQEALMESEERFRAMVESTSDWLWAVDENSIYTYASPKVREILGYEPAELIGKTPFDLMPPQEGARVADLYERIVQSREPFQCLEKTIQAKEGRLVVLEASGVPIVDPDGNFRGYRGVDRDITERKRTEQELRERRLQLQTILESAPAGILVVDASGSFIFKNRLAEELLGGQVTGTAYGPKGGYTVHHLDGSPFDPGDFPLARALRGEPARDEELLIRYQSGENRMLLASAKAIKTASGEISGAVASVQDITERKKAEEELQKQRDQLEEAQEIAKSGSWEWDIVNDKITGSKELYRILEIEPEGLKATFEAFLGFVHREDRKTVKESVTRALTEKRSFALDHRIETPDGREKILHTRGAAFSDQSGKPILMRGSSQDITSLREKEKEMMKVAKLESLGILAGGIAHDFNNILTSILGNIELAKMALPPGSSAAEKISVAGQACERAKGLSQQLLTFAKGGAPIKKLHSVPDIIKDSAALALRGSNVKSVYSFPAGLRPIEVDETQLSQVVNNLVINADQAMPEGGTLEITASNVRLEQGNVHELEPGKYVRIDFRDQGIGIPRKYFDKIFDPYFTTKEKGSGLGLAVCYSIIKKHGGILTVDSTLGKGSTFSIFLPASQNDQIASEAPLREARIGGNGRVLVMDDDETVLHIAAEMLQHLGYRPETVKDGAEALSAYESALQQGEPFEIVIVDLTVPGGMGGKETARRLLEIDPQARIIVSSGYANDPIMSAYHEYGFKGVIPKPYKLAELSAMLQDVHEAPKN